jgi:hypothetical protein
VRIQEQIKQEQLLITSFAFYLCAGGAPNGGLHVHGRILEVIFIISVESSPIISNVLILILVFKYHHRGEKVERIRVR